MEPLGYVVFWVQVDGMSRYNEDQVALVITNTSEFTSHVPVVLGTPMVNQVMQVIKQSEIDKLVMPLAQTRVSLLLRVHMVNADSEGGYLSPPPLQYGTCPL